MSYCTGMVLAAISQEDFSIWFLLPNHLGAQQQGENVGENVTPEV